MPNPKSTAQIAGHPIHPMLIPFPIAFFVGTFVCDLVYWQMSNPAWAAATLWLLGAGLVMATLAAVMGLYQIPEGVTRWGFPNRCRSDSRWRTKEVRHVGSDTIAVGF